MSYIKALHLILQRLEMKNHLKGESFRVMNKREVEQLLIDEYEEWVNSKGKHVTEELCDIAVCCIINIERLLQDEPYNL